MAGLYETEITVDVSAECDTCHGSGAKPGTHAATCRQCNGHGKVRAQQGFFVVERTCPVCQGSGQVIADPCNDCRGEGRVDKTKTLQVNIPPGVDEGTRIRLTGEGEAGPRGAPAGDLYIFLHVKRHAIFEREGTTLFARAPVSFTTAATLVNEMMEARDERRLLRLQKQLAGVKLMIIDELGFVPLSKTGAELLFELISQRYERGSTLITSNLPFDEWTETFGTERLTGALLDRLTHHVNILEMNGVSYRLSQSRARKARSAT